MSSLFIFDPYEYEYGTVATTVGTELYRTLLFRALLSADVSQLRQITNAKRTKKQEKVAAPGQAALPGAAVLRAYEYGTGTRACVTHASAPRPTGMWVRYGSYEYGTTPPSWYYEYGYSTVRARLSFF